MRYAFSSADELAELKAYVMKLPAEECSPELARAYSSLDVRLFRQAGEFKHPDLFGCEMWEKSLKFDPTNHLAYNALMNEYATTFTLSTPRAVGWVADRVELEHEHVESWKLLTLVLSYWEDESVAFQGTAKPLTSFFKTRSWWLESFFSLANSSHVERMLNHHRDLLMWRLGAALVLLWHDPMERGKIFFDLCATCFLSIDGGAPIHYICNTFTSEDVNLPQLGDRLRCLANALSGSFDAADHIPVRHNKRKLLEVEEEFPDSIEVLNRRKKRLLGEIEILLSSQEKSKV